MTEIEMLYKMLRHFGLSRSAAIDESSRLWCEITFERIMDPEGFYCGVDLHPFFCRN